ncbi:MAG: hypothetical protein A4E53_03122 [Pelotomaculum sp. PtaB.Bin104]|nr:MAG: hypothetical protein A4E53_03122 [Pelotomaculum sp. PtaB.Bin104]
MVQLPDVIGYPLEEAVERCKALGFAVDIIIARPVKEFTGKKLRVVRFKQVSEKEGELTVVYEDIKKGGK